MKTFRMWRDGAPVALPEGDDNPFTLTSADLNANRLQWHVEANYDGKQVARFLSITPASLQVVHSAETGWTIEIVSFDESGDLTFNITIDGDTFGPFTRTAAQQSSGVPVNHIGPVIAETGTPGTYEVTSPGLWTHGLTSPALTYQWTRDTVAIGGATSITYAKTGADDGTDLRCEVAVDGVAAASNAIPLAPPASSGVTRQTFLIRDVADGVASWEVDCGFSADAGDIVLVEAYANRTAGTSQNIQTLTVNGESATRHRAVNTGSAHFGMAAVFSVQLVAAITSTSKLLVTLEGDAEGNVFVLQPTRLVGYAATPHNSSTVSSVDTSQTITLNIPADGAAFAIFCANTGDAQTITGLTQDYGAGFTNQSGRYVAMGFNTGMSVETARAISVTDAVPNSISRRGCAISFAKV